MAFVHPGVIHFPEIPLLTVRDVWTGVGPDAGKLLYNINQGIWSRTYVIVDSTHYAFDLIPQTEGQLRKFFPGALSVAKAETRMDALSWTDGQGCTLMRLPSGNWGIVNPAWDVPGEPEWENRYDVAWGYDGFVATPIGPWNDDGHLSNVSFTVDWPRLQRQSAIGSNMASLYVPATTYCESPPSGNLRVGVPSWRNADLGTICRTATASDIHWTGMVYAYLFEDGTGFRESLLPGTYEWTDPDTGVLYSSDDSPSPGSAWTVKWYDDRGGSGTVEFSWNGWIVGWSDEREDMAEMGRLV